MTSSSVASPPRSPFPSARGELAPSLACAAVLLSLLCAACGDDGAEPTGGGSTSAGAGAGGDGGSGGAWAGCPVGSHETDPRVCVATLGAFSEGPSLAFARDHHVTWISTRPSGTYLYAAAGGEDMTTQVRSIERSPIAADGSLGPWETITGDPNTSGPILATTDDTVIFAGGYRGLAQATRTVDVYAIDDAGEMVGPTAGPLMIDTRFHGAGVLVNGWVYATGGVDVTGTSLQTVERAQLGPGTLGAWVADTPMLDRRSHHGLATDGKHLFATGGLERIENDFGNDTPRTDVLRTTVLEDGSLGPWESISTLPEPIAVHSSFVHAGQLYIVSGLHMDSSHFTESVSRATIADDGSLGAWETLPVELPMARGHTHQTPMHQGILYSVAGHDHGMSQIEVFFARFE